MPKSVELERCHTSLLLRPRGRQLVQHITINEVTFIIIIVSASSSVAEADAAVVAGVVVISIRYSVTRLGARL